VPVDVVDEKPESVGNNVDNVAFFVINILLTRSVGLWLVRRIRPHIHRQFWPIKQQHGLCSQNNGSYYPLRAFYLTSEHYAQLHFFESPQL